MRRSSPGLDLVDDGVSGKFGCLGGFPLAQGNQDVFQLQPSGGEVGTEFGEANFHFSTEVAQVLLDLVGLRPLYFLIGMNGAEIGQDHLSQEGLQSVKRFIHGLILGWKGGVRLGTQVMKAAACGYACGFVWNR